MLLDKDIAVPVRDGATLRANIFHPSAEGRFPVLLTFGPYGKDVHLSQFMPPAWEMIRQRHLDIQAASSLKHMVFETPDPETWTPHGYIVIKVDSRGTGKSPGRLDINSPAEFRDFYDAIEWAGTQPWSSGKVGLLGISYYAAGQWSVAAMRPPHLAAILPWQGTFDFFRDRTRQDGIFASGFVRRWWANSVLRNQYGNPDTPFLDIMTGERNTGPATLNPEELGANREDYIANVLAHPTLDDWYRERIPDLGRIELPALVVANWGGLGLHLRGTIAGFMGIASQQKWLKVQAGSYFVTFLKPENVALQRKFFDRYLKDLDNGWENEPRVTVEVRAPEDSLHRTIVSTDWPLPNTQWSQLYLDASAHALVASASREPASASYSALGDGVTFSSAPMDRDVEIAGPAMARLWVSSSTDDMDLFVTLRAFDPQGKEMTFMSAGEPQCPVSQGWLRVSQRKLDPRRSTEWRPHHTHDEIQKMQPGEVYPVDIEIWPTSLFLPSGYRLAVTFQGRDFERVGWFTHDDPVDRPASSFAGSNTIHTGTNWPSYLLLPVISFAQDRIKHIR